MKKIIIVDDQEVFRISLKEELKTIPNTEIIGEAKTGGEFLYLLVNKKPDIVFMDIEMPLMDGIETTKKAIAMYPNLVIIGLSFYNNKSYIEKLMDVGARGYLLKEGDNHELFETIIKYPEAEIFYSKELIFKPDKINKIKNILLVDDFETNLLVIRTALKMRGFNTDITKNPFDALQMANNSKKTYDLFIIDFKMPGMNGAELTEKIRQIVKYENTPVLMLSSETSRDKKLLAKKAGATGWIRKPLLMNKFIKITETLL